MNISVIVPTYKDIVDKDKIGKLFTDLRHNIQLIVSTDIDPHVGKGNAILDALSVITEDYVVIMDADLQISPQEVDTFFKIMQLYDADVCVGNKYHPYSSIEYPLKRKVVSWGFHVLTKVLFGLSLRDTQCGFKLFKTSVLRQIMPLLKEKRYCLDLEMLVCCKEQHIRVVEAPVNVKKQVNQGSVNLSTIWVTFWDTLKVWERKQKGAYTLSS